MKAWVRVGLGAALVAVCAAAVWGIPRLFASLAPRSEIPPFAMLCAVALVVSLCTIGLVWLGLGATRLGPAAIGYVAAYNVLIVVAKLALGPYAFYVTNRAEPLQSYMTGLIPTSVAGIFLLYGAALLVLYLVAVRRYNRATGVASGPAGSRRALGIVALTLPALLVALAVISGGTILIVPFLLFPYPFLLVGTPVALGVAAALLVALASGALAYQRIGDAAIAVRSSSLLTVALWTGLGLLVLYHVLWVVLVLTLFALWPLRTVSEK